MKQEVVMLVLGWFMGLLTTPIVNEIERRRTAPRLGNALRQDLDELRMQCGMLAFSIRAKYGEAGRAEIEAVIRQLSGLTDDAATRNLERLQPLLALTDEGLGEALRRAYRLEEPSEPGLLLRRLELPFLTTRLHELDLFSSSTQQALIRISGDARRANEIIDDATKYFNLTFDSSLSQANLQIARSNLRNAQLMFATIATRIAESALVLGTPS